MKLATITFAALAAAIAVGPADAAPNLNGHQIKGIAHHAAWANGIGINGVAYNALLTNGAAYNALIGNGVAFNSLTGNGIGYNALANNGVTERGSAGAKLVTCTTGAEPVCELAPVFHVQSVALGNGKKLELR